MPVPRVRQPTKPIADSPQLQDQDGNHTENHLEIPVSIQLQLEQDMQQDKTKTNEQMGMVIDEFDIDNPDIRSMICLFNLLKIILKICGCS